MESGGRLDNLLKNCLQEASKGRRFIKKCYPFRYVKKYYPEKWKLMNSGRQLDFRSAILIFPDDEPEVLSAAYTYLDQFLKSFYYDEAVIITSVAVDDAYMKTLTTVPLRIYHCSEQIMKQVLRYASAIQLGRAALHLKVLSLKMPFSQKADGIVGFKHITTEMMVYYCLYGLFGSHKPGGEN